MEMEQAAPAASDAATAAPATDAQVATHQPELGDLAAAGSATPEDDIASLASMLPADDGTEDYEFEGEKLRIPTKLKPLLLMREDYTRKTQETAEERRAIAAERDAHQRQVQFQQQNIKEVASLVSIDNQLSEYDKLDWPTLISQNPQQAMLLDQQRRALQGQKAQIAQSLTQKQQQQGLEQKRATAKRIQETNRELERDIKGWSLEYANKLGDYGKTLGFSPELLNTVAQLPFAAPLVKALHKAHQYDQLVAQRSAKPAATPATPVTKVTARASTAVVDPDKLSPADWLKHRTEQIAAKRKKR